MSNSVYYGVYRKSGITEEGEVGRADFLSDTPALTHPVLTGASDGNVQELTIDPKPFWFVNAAGKGRVLVTETKYDEVNGEYTPQLSKFSVYDEDLVKKWPASGTVNWGDLINVYAIATATVNNVKYIYGIDYDEHKIFRVKDESASGSGTDPDTDSYTYDPNTSYVYTDGSVEKFGVDLLIDGGFAHALFIRGNDVFGGEYDSSAIVKIPLSLDPTAAVISTGLAKNAFRLAPYGDYIFVPSIGGYQHDDGTWNAESRIQKVAKSDLAVTDLLRAATTAETGADESDKTDFRDLAITQSGKAFILKGKFVDEFGFFDAYVFITTAQALANYANQRPATDLDLVPTYFEEEFGYYWALVGDSNDADLVWFARGSTVGVYKDNSGQFGPVAGELGFGNGTPADYLASNGFQLNLVTPSGVTPTLRGAVHPHVASNSKKAGAKRAAVAKNLAAKAARAARAAKAAGAPGLEEE
jgi:hypothetical protein